MEVISIDTNATINLCDNLVAISDNMDSYNENFAEYVTKLQTKDIWRGLSATYFRDLSKEDIEQYKSYSESIRKIGDDLKKEIEALEDEINSLKDF